MRTVHFSVLGTAKIAREKVIPALQKGEHTAVTALASRSLDRAGDTADSLDPVDQYTLQGDRFARARAARRARVNAAPRRCRETARDGGSAAERRAQCLGLLLSHRSRSDQNDALRFSRAVCTTGASLAAERPS